VDRIAIPLGEVHVVSNANNVKKSDYKMNLRPIDYRARHKRAAELMDQGALVVMSQPTAYRNSTVSHSYRQDSFFQWLTGFEEPGSCFVLLANRPEGERTHLFVREKNPERELWDGRRLGVEGAAKTLMIDKSHSVESFWRMLPELLGDASKVWFNLGVNEEYDRNFIKALGQHKASYGKKNLSCKIPIHDSLYLAGLLRLRKSPEELDRMRSAAGITRKTFEQIYKSVRPGMSEKDVFGIIQSEFFKNGADMESYGTIIAGGVNACILHYVENNQPLRDGELLLIDAGAQFHYYASDVTRTFPIGKKFSPEQLAMYEIVLRSQKAAIAKATVGSTLPAIHDEAISVLTDGLLDLKLLKGSKAEIIEKGGFKRFYPHGTSHWIGMDVHDVGVYNESGHPVFLDSGMFFSVEPGLYVQPDDETAPKAFRGIGIRIEDDVLVTEDGPEVLTSGIAKEVKDLENRW
jgi:Xaa-Pro aminopeptidase